MRPMAQSPTVDGEVLPVLVDRRGEPEFTRGCDDRTNLDRDCDGCLRSVAAPRMGVGTGVRTSIARTKSFANLQTCYERLWQSPSSNDKCNQRNNQNDVDDRKIPTISFSSVTDRIRRLKFPMPRWEVPPQQQTGGDKISPPVTNLYDTGRFIATYCSSNQHRA